MTNPNDEVREKILNRIDFLSDHWIKGDDRPPFSFGGWREEVADELVNIYEALLASERKQLVEENIRLKADMAHAIGYCRGIGHPDPKEAKKLADALLEFAKTIAKLTGEPEPTMEIVEPTTTEEL